MGPVQVAPVFPVLSLYCNITVRTTNLNLALIACIYTLAKWQPLYSDKTNEQKAGGEQGVSHLGGSSYSK